MPMIRFLKIFLILVVLYHLLVTIVWYGILGWLYPQIPALGRDTIYLIFFVSIAIYHKKNIKVYLQTRKRLRITLIILLAFGTGISLIKGKAIYDIFVGIKYGLLYLCIFLSATFVGWAFTKKNTKQFLNFLKYLLITTIIVGFLRQWMKFIWPDIFLHTGYGPLDDFKFGIKPPIYYLTGYQGTARRQGIFAWPNNYGYFLIAFLPVLLFFLRQNFENIKQLMLRKRKTIINIAIIWLRILAILLTLSRAAFIWWIVGLTIINIQRIRTHKKIWWGIGVTLVLGLIGLSILKWASTIDHIKAKFGSLAYVIQQPSGYGLGTSGPAVNHNGTILPENYYIQLILDIGTIWFILRAMLIIQITAIGKKIQEKYKKIIKTNNKENTYLIRKWLSIGWICLLVMGVFLHVFEDSMINYLLLYFTRNT